MDRDEELLIVRRAYAKQLMAEAGAANRRVEAAFATVPRERYLGRGPWPIIRRGRYVPTPSRNPVYLYADVRVGIIPERRLNNGQPSFLASLIAAAAPRTGEHAVHIGAGVGYYTAILAHLVRPPRTGNCDRIRRRPGGASRRQFRRDAKCRSRARRRFAHRLRCGRCDPRQCRCDAPG
jgi:protein-L-isoaspartate(D-aspartate) O-methyltransferase